MIVKALILESLTLVEPQALRSSLQTFREDASSQFHVRLDEGKNSLHDQNPTLLNVPTFSNNPLEKVLFSRSNLCRFLSSRFWFFFIKKSGLPCGSN